MSRLKRAYYSRLNETMVRKVRAAMVEYGVSVEDLASAAHICPATLYNRFHRPEQIQLKELRAIADKLHMPLPKLLGVTNDV